MSPTEAANPCVRRAGLRRPGHPLPALRRAQRGADLFAKWRSLGAGLGLTCSLAFAPQTADAQTIAPQPWTEGTGSAVVSQGYDPARSLAPLVEAVTPAVVSIQATREQTSGRGQSIPIPGMPGGMGFPFGMPGGEGGPATGSGFVISADGLVVTNHHVIDGRGKIRVKLGDGRSFAAELIGSDPQTDIALLRLKGASGLKHVVFGSSDRLAVGDWVLAIGSPLGLDKTVTRGIVSAKGRGDLGLYKRGYADFLQTDAAISPGNSGGPLFNLAGEVVGINTAISRAGNDLGFSIPIDQAKHVLPQLLKYGVVARGWLGIIGETEIREAADSSGKQAAPQKGARLSQVQKNGPAWKAGLREGDRIVSVDHQAIENFADLRARIGEYRPGTRLPVRYKRGGKLHTTQVHLGKQPDGQTLERWGSGFPDGDTRGRGDNGNSGKSLYGQGPARLGVRVAVREGQVLVRGISRPEGVGAQLGLRPGDRIIKVNGATVRTLPALKEALGSDRQRVEVEFVRDGVTRVAMMMAR